MKPRRHKNGFTISEFLITISSLFAGFYFIFWSCYLGSNYTLAHFYLKDYSLCDLNLQPRSCWQILKRRMDSLKFVDIQRLYLETTPTKKSVYVVFNYDLPMIGLTQGVRDIQLSSSLTSSAWQ